MRFGIWDFSLIFPRISLKVRQLTPFSGHYHCNTCTNYLNTCGNYLNTCTNYLNTCRDYLNTCTNYLNTCTNYLNTCRDYLNTCTNYLNTCRDYLNTCSNYLNTCTNYLNTCRDYLNTCANYLNTCTNYYSFWGIFSKKPGEGIKKPAFQQVLTPNSKLTTPNYLLNHYINPSIPCIRVGNSDIKYRMFLFACSH